MSEQEKLVKDFFLFLEKNYGWGNKLQNLIASVFVICSCWSASRIHSCMAKEIIEQF